MGFAFRHNRIPRCSNRLLGLCLLLLFSGCTALTAAEGETKIKLTGIVCWSHGKRAVLEIQETVPNRRFPRQSFPILREGEREGTVEVLSIDEKAAEVRVRTQGREVTLPLEQNAGDALANRTINLRSARSRQVLDLYQEISGRTVICNHHWAQFVLDLQTGAALSANNAAKALDTALGQKGLLIKLYRDKFAFVVNEREAGLLKTIPDVPVANDNKSQEVFPPGMFKFVDAEQFQVLAIYQELSGRTILQPGLLPNFKVTARSQTPLTRTEGIWLLDAVFWINKVAMVPETDKFTFCVPMSRTNNLPKFDAKAIQAKMTAKAKTAPGTLNFSDARCEQVLASYAKLLGREALPLEKNVPRVSFNLRSQTSLSVEESIFAIEAAVALSNLRFELEQEKVKIVPARNSF